MAMSYGYGNDIDGLVLIMTFSIDWIDFLKLNWVSEICYGIVSCLLIILMPLIS